MDDSLHLDPRDARIFEQLSGIGNLIGRLQRDLTRAEALPLALSSLGEIHSKVDRLLAEEFYGVWIRVNPRASRTLAEHTCPSHDNSDASAFDPRARGRRARLFPSCNVMDQTPQRFHPAG